MDGDAQRRHVGAVIEAADLAVPLYNLGLGNACPAPPLITADDRTRATIATLENHHLPPA